MSIDVVFVDDDISAAKSYSRLVQAKTKLKTEYTSDPEVAMLLLKENAVKVFVLDQRMPLMSGTELYKKLIEIDGNFKAIMLTGEAAANEAGDAINQGYNYYLEKGRVSELPSKIFNLIALYEADLSEKESSNLQQLVYSERKGFLFGPRIDFFLISIEIIDNEYIYPDSWKTIVAINAGEKIRHTERFEISSTVKFDIESEANLKMTLDLDYKSLVKLKTKLETNIKEKIKRSLSIEEKKQYEIEKEYSLPNEETNPNILHVISRQYQFAPVFLKIRLFIRVTCDTVGISQVFSMDVTKETNIRATRQIDYLSDNSKKELLTGFISS